MRVIGRLSVVLACVLFVQALVPTLAHAQATLAGVVRDTSGAVLPGATVEATSDVLIEKVRSAVSDGSGQYRITDLPPGTYNITFALPGFNAVARPGVQVSGTGVIPINVEMRVGAIQETVTVTGETPLVDTQSTRRESVLSDEIIAAMPATRTYGALLAAVPGLMTNTGALGAMATPDMTFFTAHGGRGNEGRVHIDGLPVAASFNGGGVSTFTYDTANAEEMQVLVSGGLGEAEAGGPSINLVPRSGGNAFSGSAFYNAAGEWSSGNNITPYLDSIGITEPPAIIKLWDVSASVGGPIMRDRLWFFGSARQYGNFQAAEGLYANRYAGDASRWDYATDESVLGRTANSRDIGQFRLTAQVSDRNRVSFSHEYQHRCTGSSLSTSGEACRARGDDWISNGSRAFGSPEAFPGYHDTPYNVTQATWSSPLSSRILLEAGFSRFQYIWYGFGQASPDRINLIPVSETVARDGHPANFTYRGIYDPFEIAFADNNANPNNWRATASYVTGSHNVKVGYQGSYQRSLLGREANTTLLRYSSNTPASNVCPGQLSPPCLNGVSYYIAPRWEQNDRTATASLFAQDQWTFGRWTVQGALRYDRAWSWSPAEHNGTDVIGIAANQTKPFLTAPIAFDKTVSVDAYNDITTRLGVAWDVFGNGKTSVKANLGKYLQNATNDENYVANNPARRIVTRVGGLGQPARGWVDGNNNRIVDCDLTNPDQQITVGGDTCGALQGVARNFGVANPNLTIINQDILHGWGVRPADWQFGVSVQQEVIPRVSAEVGYYRRSFLNFFVVDNQLVGPSDYDRWTYTAPVDDKLPDGGGYAIDQYAITRAAALRGAQNYQTFETDFGDARSQYWDGVDVSVNARLQNGLTIQGGTSTGRGVRDRCDSVVNIDSPDPRGCRVVEPLMTSVRGLAAYTVPKIDVLVSAQFRSLNAANTLAALVGAQSASNGASLNANTAVPNSVIISQIGRAPGTALPNQTTTVNLVEEGQLYPDERVNQVDMRFAKIFRFGGKRLDVGMDLYNLFNTSDGTAFDQNYDYGVAEGGEFLRPTTIVSPRFLRFNVTFNW
jgi:hypothetical protein